MRVFSWLRRSQSSQDKQDKKVAAWRSEWARAVEAHDRSRLDSLRESLDGLALSADDREIESEMLAGLEQLLDLQHSWSQGEKPMLTTGHRVVGSDVCHFIAPASSPDDPGQPTGQLILTNVRAIFAGGGRASTVPWHAVAQVLQTDRDFALLRVGPEAMYRFRFNTFADALCGAFIARSLATHKRK